MVTESGDLTQAERADLDSLQEHWDSVNRRENDSNMRGLVTALQGAAAATGDRSTDDR
jgi:hypothetical protein